MVRQVVAGALDAASVLLFVGIGRSVHAHGVSVPGMASTSWPFLAGAAVGWAASRAWHLRPTLLRAGAAVWLACVLLGMVLRVASGQGTAVPFVGVALAFLGAEMLGWRVLARWASMLNGRRAA